MARINMLIKILCFLVVVSALGLLVTSAANTVNRIESISDIQVVLQGSQAIVLVVLQSFSLLLLVGIIMLLTSNETQKMYNWRKHVLLLLHCLLALYISITISNIMNHFIVDIIV